MKIIKNKVFHAITTKINKFYRIPRQANENNENLIISPQNHENHEIPRIPCQNHANHINLIIPIHNQEYHKILIIPQQNHENN